jgi:hypothetical protein
VREVRVQIQFVTPCLGADKRTRDRLGTVFCFPRAHDGRVMFQQSWWRSIMTYAASMRNIPASFIKQVNWSPWVDGSPRLWQRYIIDPSRPNDGRRVYAQHEAFLPEKVVGIECVVPPSLSLDVFRGLLEVAGKYRGISPYKPGEYGRFSVADLHTSRRIIVERSSLKGDEPTGGPSGGLA